jgi:hypothetical protein
MSQDIELQDSPTPVEDANLENSEPTQEEVKEAEAAVASLSPQEKAQLFRRLKKLEQGQKQTPNTQVEPAPSPNQVVPRETAPAENREYTDLRIDGYSADEIEKIEKIARANGQSLREAVKDPFVQAGIASMRESGAAEAATPPPSSQPSTTPKPEPGAFRQDMTPAEKEAWFAAKKKKVADRRSNK